MSIFTPMHTVHAPGEAGPFKLEHFDFGEPTIRMRIGKEPWIAPGKYVRLTTKHDVVMSDTQFEHDTNYEVVKRAKGDVLIAGLGIGMIVLPILRKPGVRSVTVLEKYPEVISLVLPGLKAAAAEIMAGKTNDPAFSVLHADALTWELPKGQKWDTVYFDIWNNICSENLKTATQLKRRFARRKNPGGWMGVWAERECRRGR